MTLFSDLYERVHAHPTVGPALDAVPVRVRLHDGQRRIAPFGLWRLARVWRSRPELQAESAAAFDAYNGGDVLDVGAFEGWYSALLAPKARPGDRLVSVEPDAAAFPELLASLARLARLFPDQTFVPVDAAAGDGRPVVVTRPPSGHPQFTVAEGGDGQRTVPLDELVTTLGLRPRFVKIDVEGAEPFVLEGLRRTLTEHRPVVALELHHGWLPEDVTPADVEATMTGHGYAKAVLDINDINEHQLWTTR